MSSLASFQLMQITQAQLRRDLNALFASLAQECRTILLSAAQPDGTISPQRRADVLRLCGERTQRMFVGADLRHAYLPDTTRPLSPYAALLNSTYARVVSAVLRIHARAMENRLDPDTFRWLASASFTVPLREGTPAERRRDVLADLMSEPGDLLRRTVLRETRLQPPPAYDAMHTWVDANGYTLSDRIWQTSLNTRRKIDLFLTESIRNGVGALDMAAQLERFLLPERANLRTLRPYGVDASYDAMRLARTEIAQAHNRAAMLASIMNPYVDRYDVRRSRRGDPKCPICPQYATIDMSGQRIRPPYALNEGRSPVYHPQCKCVHVPVVVDDPAAVSVSLRNLRLAGESAPATAAALQTLLAALLGAELLRLLSQ